MDADGVFPVVGHAVGVGRGERGRAGAIGCAPESNRHSTAADFAARIGRSEQLEALDQDAAFLAALAFVATNEEND
jgi:hypothetical protein